MHRTALTTGLALAALALPGLAAEPMAADATAAPAQSATAAPSGFTLGAAAGMLEDPDLATGAETAEPLAKSTRRFEATGGWTGFYGGVQLGVADADLDGSGGSDTSVVGGVHFGYNYQMGPYVVGAELSGSLSDNDLSGVNGGEIDTLGRLGLRLGRAFGDTLIYTGGGVAFVDGEYNGRDEEDVGYFVGVGLDQRISERWVAGLAANYHGFDDFAAGRDLDFLTVEARLSFRF